MTENLYNLAFGDVNAKTSQIDDFVVTNNGNSKKVLATVVEVVRQFCNRFPWASIYATGSTSARTRFYRMGINKYLTRLFKTFILSDKNMTTNGSLFEKAGITKLSQLREENVDLDYEK